LLSGETPFKGANPVAIAMQHLKNPPPPLKEKNPALPDILCRVVHRMMAKRRSLRYQSADEVLEDLKKLVTAHKQGRSLDLVKLPRLEELEKLAEEERAKHLKAGGTIPPEGFDDVGLELPSAAPVNQTAVMPSRWAAENFVAEQPKKKVAPAPAVITVDDDDDVPYVRKSSGPPNDFIDLTPAVDVTFQLLIFFMVTASFSMQKAFDVPPAKNVEGVSLNVTVPLDESPGVKVQVDPNNVMYVDSKKATTYQEIYDLLTAEKNAASGVSDLDLELDPESIHEMRIIVIDAATQAGFTRVRNKIVEFQ
jgi:biopolymer transport protein ExbD